MANGSNIHGASDPMTHDLDELTAEFNRDKEIERLESEAVEREQDFQNMEVYIQPTHFDGGGISSYRVFVGNHRAARRFHADVTQVGLIYPGQDNVRWLTGYKIQWGSDGSKQPGILTEKEQEKITKIAVEKATKHGGDNPGRVEAKEADAAGNGDS